MTLIDQIKQDREAGTPGPWSAFDTSVYIGRTGDVDSDGAPNWGGFDIRNCPTPETNARRIARVPQMEKAILKHERWLEQEIGHCDAAGYVMTATIYTRALTAFRKALENEE